MTMTLSAATEPELTDDLINLVRQHSSWMEENRRQHPEVVEGLLGSGLFSFRAPPGSGGNGASYQAISETISALARVDGSSAWTVAVSAITSWMASHLPDPVVDEVFQGPTQTCGTLSPSGTLIPKGSGGSFELNGMWKFISGAPSSKWQVVIAVSPVPGQPDQMMPVYAVVPMTDLHQVDDWYTTGLRGTGSITTVAENLAVPAERVAPLPPLLDGVAVGQSIQGEDLFTSPLVPTASALSAGVAPGLATAALDDFRARISTKPITYTGYEKQSDAPITHIQLAQATHLWEESNFQLAQLTELLDSYDGSASYWDPQRRVLSRARLGRSTELALQAGRTVGDASGGSSIYIDAPVQKPVRDLHAISMHALINPATNQELYGRAIVGLEPTTLYV